jgi:hypothetical protein
MNAIHIPLFYQSKNVILKSLFDVCLLELQFENKTKKFHFMEIDWLVYFPKCGNKGKYLNYNVTLIDRKKGANQPEKIVKIKEIVENAEFEKQYPHTAGFFKEPSGDGAEFKPEYLEIRKITTVEELWLFLNALDI